MRSRRALLSIAAAVGLAASAFLAGATPTAAGGGDGDIHIQADLNLCFRVQSPQGNQQTTITWKDAAGHQKAKFTGESDQFANVEVPQPVCEAHVVEVGDRIKAHTPDSPMVTRTLVIPRLTGRADRTLDVLTGTAPADSTVYITFPGLLKGGCNKHVTASSSGAWKFKAERCDQDLVGGNIVYASLVNGHGDVTTLGITVPYLQLTIGSARVTGIGDPNSTVSATLRSAGNALIASGHGSTDRYGAFSFKLRDGSGNAVKVAAGQRIAGDWAESDHFQVPALSYSISGNAVTGHCTPDTYYNLVVSWDNGNGSYAVGATTDGSGATNPLDPSPHTLTDDDKLEFTCFRPTLDRVRLLSTVGAER